jgi:hypothetical protein
LLQPLFADEIIRRIAPFKIERAEMRRACPFETLRLQLQAHAASLLPNIISNCLMKTSINEK